MVKRKSGRTGTLQNMKDKKYNGMTVIVEDATDDGKLVVQSVKPRKTALYKVRPLAVVGLTEKQRREPKKLVGRKIRLNGNMNHITPHKDNMRLDLKDKVVRVLKVKKTEGGKRYWLCRSLKKERFVKLTVNPKKFFPDKEK